MPKCFVIGFKDNPEKISVIHTTVDNADKVIEQHGFATHWVEEDFGYYEYLVIQAYKRINDDNSLDVIQFEDKAPAILNIDMRSKTSFLYDVGAKKFISTGILLWENRDKANNSGQAMKYVASRLSELFYGIDKKEAAELTEYAKKFNVPLNLDMHKEFQKVFKTEHPNWNSSDGRCPW